MVILFSETSGAATPWSRCRVANRGDFNWRVGETREKLERRSGCREHFNAYFEDLLRAAEGYPDPANKQKFSDFLIWASDAGIITRRQAEEQYNRYFTPKFLTLMGEYNLCSSMCARQGSYEADLERELGDKERGLLRICRDQTGFNQANRLFSDSIVVISATCRACEGGN